MNLFLSQGHRQLQRYEIIRNESCTSTDSSPSAKCSEAQIESHATHQKSLKSLNKSKSTFSMKNKSVHLERWGSWYVRALYALQIILYYIISNHTILYYIFVYFFFCHDFYWLYFSLMSVFSFNFSGFCILILTAGESIGLTTRQTRDSTIFQIVLGNRKVKFKMVQTPYLQARTVNRKCRYRTAHAYISHT